MSEPYGDHDVMEDAFSAEGEPEPHQTARKMHNEGNLFVILAGGRFKDFDNLSDAEFEVALAIAEHFISKLQGRDTEVDMEAQEVHAVRRYLDPQLPEWNDLPDPEKFVARTLVQRVLLWMTKEGTIR